MRREFGAFFLALTLVFALPAGVAQAAVEPLVSTKWVAGKLETIADPGQTDIRLVEVSKSYDKGHIPGSVHIKWGSDVFAPGTDHMVLGLDEVERVLRKLGITPDTHIVIYDGDDKPHHVARFYWTLKYWNFDNVSIMDGGKRVWEKEDRKLTKAVPEVKPRSVEAEYPPDTGIRAMFSPHITHALATGEKTIVDSRTEDFYKGLVYSLHKWVRSGHITGAVNVPTMWSVNADGTFKSREELQTIYADRGVTADKQIITYCDTGVLGAHAWFVMSELLGYKNVSLYDGSMREYANRLNTPMQPGRTGGQFPETSAR